MLDAVDTPVVIGLEDDLGVAFGVEGVTLGLQFGAQFRVVVDCAIEDHAQAQVRIKHRLLGVLGQVHDLESALAKGAGAIGEQAMTIGAAPRHLLGHPGYRSHIGRLAVETNLS